MTRIDLSKEKYYETIIRFNNLRNLEGKLTYDDFTDVLRLQYALDTLADYTPLRYALLELEGIELPAAVKLGIAQDIAQEICDNYMFTRQDEFSLDQYKQAINVLVAGSKIKEHEHYLSN